jgi:uncharacterized protein YlaI
MAKVLITPCCKSKHWIHAVGKNFEELIRCQLCDKLHDIENLLEVVKGLNPLTYFCDNCHKSALDELKESRDKCSNRVR